MVHSASFLLLGFLGTSELLIVAAVFLLLFGGAKLPGLMRNLGRSVNEFKTGIKEKPVDSDLEDDHDRVESRKPDRSLEDRSEKTNV